MYKTIGNIGLMLSAIALVALVVWGNTHGATATNTIEASRVTQVVTALPTSASVGNGILVLNHGENTVWVNPTAIPTDFVGTVQLRDCNRNGIECVVLTPTVNIGTTGSISYTFRETPVILSNPMRGTYSDVVVNNTSAATGTMNLTWYRKNTTQ